MTYQEKSTNYCNKTSFKSTCFVMEIKLKKSPYDRLWRYRGYYMAARGYEFYLRVLQVSLTSERYFQHEKIKFVSPSGHVMFCLLYRY